MADDVQLGRMVQDLRLSRNMSQEDVADRAGVSRGTVSRLEHGIVDCMTVGALRTISGALSMPSIVKLGWRAPELERLRDRLHAALVEDVAARLGAVGWEVVPEYSFNHFGERGSADLLAWRAAARALLIVETKTRLWDLQALLNSLDRKRRLVPEVVARDRGWRPLAVGVVLVLPEMSTHRHVVERHAATFKAALPHRQVEVRHWLAEPLGDLRGLWFLPIAHQDDIGQRSRRLRASKRRGGGAMASRHSQNRPI
jgi:transcriptional regulator with XRE-family HTH domain